MRVLLIDDDKNFSQKVIECLLNKGHIVEYYNHTAEAYSFIQSDEKIDLAIIDLMLEPTYKTEGIDILSFLHRYNSKIPIIMISQKNEKMITIVDQAFTIGIERFIDKNEPNFWIDLFNSIKEIENNMNNKIFISHGHNELLKLKLKDFIQNHLDRQPLILSELPNYGRTVVEKLEDASKMCNAAIILLTKDDETKEGGMRARQNVIHEIGFFQGKYGRNKVILLYEQGVEIFSNISGILRIEFSSDHFEEIYENLRTELS